MYLIRNIFDKDKWFLLLARNGFFGNWDDEKFLKRTFQAKMGQTVRKLDGRPS